MSCNAWESRWGQKTWVCDEVLRAPFSASCGTLTVVQHYCHTDVAVTALQESREVSVDSSTQESFWFITPPSSTAPGHICLGDVAAVGVWVEPRQPCQDETQPGRELWTSLKSYCVSVDAAVRAFSVLWEDGHTEAFHSQLDPAHIAGQKAGRRAWPRHEVWMSSSYNAWQLLQPSLQSQRAQRAVAI